MIIGNHFYEKETKQKIQTHKQLVDQFFENRKHLQRSQQKDDKNDEESLFVLEVEQKYL